MKHFLSLTIPFALIGSAIGWSQDAPKLNARELFYSPPPQPATGTATTGTSGATGTAAGGRSGAASGTASSTGGAAGSGRSGAASTGTVAGGGTSGGTGKSGGRSGSTKGGTQSTSGSGANSGTTTSAGTASGTTSSTTASTGAGSTSTASSGTSTTATDNGTVVTAVGQTDNTLSVSTSAPTGPLGLRYAILKRESGSFREVDPETKFRTGDSIRLQVTPSTTGYLYVVQQGASGMWTLLFPRQEVANGSNFVERGEMLAVPSDKAMWTFDAHAGEEKLFIVLARRPEPDLDKLIYSIGGGGTADSGGARLMAQSQVQVRDDVVSHLRQQMLSRDLVFEKVDETTSDSTGVKAENAAYVVSKSTAPDARLVKDLTLSHQ